MKEKIIERVMKLFEVKSLVTLGLTAGMLALLFGPYDPPQKALALFCTSYGAIIAYFFTRKEGWSSAAGGKGNFPKNRTRGIETRL